MAAPDGLVHDPDNIKKVLLSVYGRSRQKNLSVLHGKFNPVL